jgi:hypothetical protein
MNGAERADLAALPAISSRCSTRRSGLNDRTARGYDQAVHADDDASETSGAVPGRAAGGHAARGRLDGLLAAGPNDLLPLINLLADGARPPANDLRKVLPQRYRKRFIALRTAPQVLNPLQWAAQHAELLAQITVTGRRRARESFLLRCTTEANQATRNAFEKAGELADPRPFAFTPEFEKWLERLVRVRLPEDERMHEPFVVLVALGTNWVRALEMVQEFANAPEEWRRRLRRCPAAACGYWINRSQRQDARRCERHRK